MSADMNGHGSAKSYSKFDLVILNKVDKDGNFALLHNKPLTVELVGIASDFVLIFYEGKFFLSLSMNFFSTLHSEEHFSHICLMQ